MRIHHRIAMAMIFATLAVLVLVLAGVALHHRTNTAVLRDFRVARVQSCSMKPYSMGAEAVMLDKSAAQAFWVQLHAVVENGFEKTERGGIQLAFDYVIDARTEKGDMWQLRIGRFPGGAAIAVDTWRGNGSKAETTWFVSEDAGIRVYGLLGTYVQLPDEKYLGEQNQQ